MLRNQLFTLNNTSRRLFSSSSILRTRSNINNIDTTQQSKPKPTEAVWLTLYAKQGCSLCDKAKVVLDSVRVNPSLNKTLNYQYVDITDPQNNQWWDAYCFDVPVVHLDRYNQKQPVKFMHYLNEEKIVEEINKDFE
ncbi:hypothetical protein WICPIJ_002017 [Wickerhamomyces pijperi]|uniref:Glutaredoxin-like protein n=1 Tax=Wickerhamomyces pijperi TaxID=599730 RepID=A0A9P8QAI1_WICPI|nr:hypothetical protein WICPIJ_002017 [Wickerhamomyces pijperi]